MGLTCNALRALLESPPETRTPSRYEEVCDDFIRFAGGSRLSESFDIPCDRKNADYYFVGDTFDAVVELKQVNNYVPTRSVDQYFTKCFSEGKVRQFEALEPGRVRIGPESLGPREWHQFYRSLRRSVPDHLKAAARQLRMTDEFAPALRGRRIRGVLLLNSGDYNLSTDLLLRLVESKTKGEWRRGKFRSIDFVTCFTMDLFREGQHPLYARHIARTVADDLLVAFVRRLYDRWVHYGAEATGCRVEFVPGVEALDPSPDLARPFAGKIAVRRD